MDRSKQAFMIHSPEEMVMTPCYYGQAWQESSRSLINRLPCYQGFFRYNVAGHSSHKLIIATYSWS